MQILNDSQWTNGDGLYILISDNQEGNAGDHLLQIANDRVTCDGSKQSVTTHFTICTAYNPKIKKMVAILECSGGPYKNNLIGIRDNAVFYRSKTKMYINYDDGEPDVTFKIHHSSKKNTYISLELLSQPGSFLGFDSKGKPMEPNQVQKDSVESLFFRWSVKSN